MTQEQLNSITNLQFDLVRHQLYGTRFLQQPDGSIVLLYPDGSTAPLPVLEDEE